MNTRFRAGCYIEDDEGVEERVGQDEEDPHDDVEVFGIHHHGGGCVSDEGRGQEEPGEDVEEGDDDGSVEDLLADTS